MKPLPESANPLDQRPRISLAGTTSTAVFAVFLLGLALLVHETHWLNNSFGIGPVALGVVLAAAAASVWAYRSEWLKHAAAGELAVLLTLLAFGFFAAFAGGASMFNRAFAEPQPASAWRVEKKKLLTAGPKPRYRWRVQLKSAEGQYWVHLTQAQWLAAKVGEPLEAPVFKGPLGVSIVAPPPW